MAFDQTTRNRLQKFVSRARDLLADEFTRQLQYDYGMDPDTGTISDIYRLTHLDDAKHQTAVLLRDTLIHYQVSSPDSDTQEILRRIVREQAFTVLNRLSALRMAEARDILMESIANGYQSKGFQLYTRVSGPSQVNIGDTYRNYLFSVFDEFALDLAVLFDRYSPMGRLFPKESVLLDLLDFINDTDLEHLWAEDETIGWIYQYFNSKEERKKMRDESAAPRNSRELAVRNQFFTPRYVVEFLTDNTLGRIWYEMSWGHTDLKNQCRYLVRRPNEIFLEKGESSPEQAEDTADLTQEELLNLPVYVEHRPFKDPREILMLDPACGSMHFGLYAFDLFETIYQEAWDLQANGQWPVGENKKFELLTETYPTREAFTKDIPRLIIENNIHGIDIDLRAVQIAGLSLWLRAQRSWKEQQIPTGHRPDIRKANIVCAEPMPGEKELLAAFSESLKPRVLGQLVEIIFEKMALAGEAGSLLKIEEEIEDAVEKAREAFNRELLRRKDEAGYLPGMAPKIQQRELFDFADLPDKTQFWQTAEDKILEALKTYAEQAEAEEGNIRRLFTEDAAKGFAFIDLCRKRYDVVLMNPPFGALAKKSKTFTSKKYPSTWNDIYGCFIERMIEILVIGGRLGGITSSTFFNLVSFKPLRELLLHSTLPDHFVDLGSGVMDDAAVNAAISIVGKQNSSNKKPILFLDFRKSSQNEEKLQATIKLLTFGKSNSTIHNKYISFFTGLPNLILAYWLTDRIHRIFLDCGPLGAKCKNSFGLHARGNDDLVFRAWWEPSQDERFSINWPTVKLGGNPNRFVRNSDYVVNWKNNGQLLKQIAKKAQGGCLTGISLYFRKGLTYIYTGNTFSVQPLEENSIFSAAAHGLFGSLENYLILLAFLNSEPCRLLLKTINPDRFFQSGYVGLLPVPQFSNNQIIALEDVAKTFLKAKRSFLTGDECCRLFSVEWSSRYPHGTNGKLLENVKNLSKDTLNLLNREFDRLNFEVFEAYGVDAEDFDPIKERTVKPSLLSIGSDLGSVETNQTSYTSAVLSYGFGVIFGRWDIRFASGDKSPPPLPAPFESLPVCPSGMLQNTDGLPAEPKDVPADYPLRISWSGIILDDEGHPEDIITRIRETMEVIWKDNANDIEQEACEILGVRSLREYFSKPAKFFADHLKRYSKSRRQAPIYWPLSTPSGSYTLWLYYHRLTDQILYTCVNNFVGPKLKQVSEDAASLRKTSNRTKKQETELENLSVLALELTEFQDELLRIAKFWKPNLNDGVQITAAPLWKLFQYKPWQKKLKKTWKELEKGKYDWAHLAYSIWPERVIRASHKDRSFAIAHDLEKDLWEEIETGTDRQGHVKTKWVPKQLSENELKAIIQEKIRMHHHVD